MGMWCESWPRPPRASAITGVLQAARLAFPSPLTRLGPVALRPRLPPGLPLSRALLAFLLSPNVVTGFRELPRFSKIEDRFREEPRPAPKGGPRSESGDRANRELRESYL